MNEKVGSEVALLCDMLHIGSQRRSGDFCCTTWQLPCFVRGTHVSGRVRHWPADCGVMEDGGAPQALLFGFRGALSAGRPERTRRPLIMAWLIRTLRIPASESNMGLVLALCAVTMSMLSLAVAWQAQIISRQHEVIQWLAKLKLGF
jgi:hypothetical protein